MLQLSPISPIDSFQGTVDTYLYIWAKKMDNFFSVLIKNLLNFIHTSLDRLSVYLWNIFRKSLNYSISKNLFSFHKRGKKKRQWGGICIFITIYHLLKGKVILTLLDTHYCEHKNFLHLKCFTNNFFSPGKYSSSSKIESLENWTRKTNLPSYEERKLEEFQSI